MSRAPTALGIEAVAISAVTMLLLAASWFKWLPLDFTEALGFATGCTSGLKPSLPGSQSLGGG